MRKLSWSLFLLLLALASVPLTASAMKVGEAVQLLRSGVGEQVILDQLNAEGADFRLTTDDILALKAAGATDNLISEMIRRGSDQQAAAAQADTSTQVHTDLHVYYDPFDYYASYWPYGTGFYDPWIWSGWNFHYTGWWDHRWVRPGYHGLGGRPWNGHPWTGRPGDRGGRGQWNRPNGGRPTWDRGSAQPHDRSLGRSQPQAPASPSPNSARSGSRPAPSQPSRPASPGRSAWRR
jgi:hypothetical protein